MSDDEAGAVDAASVEVDIVDVSKLRLPEGTVVFTPLEASKYELEEKEVFTIRAKLFRLAPDVEGVIGWRSRCTGTIRFLFHEGSQLVRLLMRQDGTHKVFMNHVIETSTKLLPHGDAGNSYVYKAVDFAEGAAGKSETFAVKFKDAANAELFQAAFIKNQAIVRDRAGGTAFVLGSTSESSNNLLEVEAKARAALISNVSYKLHLNLTDKERYGGVCEVTLNLGSPLPESGIFLDFTGEKITELIVNGAVISPSAGTATWKEHRLTLAASVLAADAVNTVKVTYTNEYDHTGEGLHTFTDPEDNKVYVYSNFEPFEAHRMLPCFDQPDIKGALTFTATAPAAWNVIANAAVSSRDEQEGGLVNWTFEALQPISTYIFAVIAGPFEVFSDNYEGLPLRLFCRQSLAKYMDAEELFTITKQGLAFYNAFFGIPYPFSKYDQLFCPEFNQGAMENAGAVTFTESYIFRDRPTNPQRLGRADTVLHEMAHMWFGDLVTMKWWDGLWLNESFATYMAALSVAEATRFGSASWIQFNSDMKAWAYAEDQKCTTHSVNPESVVDTQGAFANFDGVTYGKGASVLKQLVALIGMDNFKAGMQLYFKKHAWGNTTLGDFLGSLQAAVGDLVDLKAWAESWLQQPGVNTLKPVFEVTGEGASAKFSSFKIEQAFNPDYPTLRSQRLTVIAVDTAGKTLVEQDAMVQAAAVTELPSLAGVPVPNLAFVYINYNDHAFAKISLDEASIAFLTENLKPSVVSSPLLRQLIWRDLYDMTRDAKLPATQYLAMVRALLPFEDDIELVSSVSGNSVRALGAFIPDALYPSEADQHAQFALSELQRAGTEDLRTQWSRSLVSCSVTIPAVERLISYLATPNSISFALEQRLRWSIIIKAVQRNIGDWKSLLDAEAVRDPSDRGKKALLQAGVAVPEPAVKEKAWARFTSPEAAKESLHDIEAEMGGFYDRNNRSLTREYNDKFFAVIVSVFETLSSTQAQAFYYGLLPPVDDGGELIAQLEALLGTITGSKHDNLIRFVRESIDDSNRIVKCRRLVAGL